MRIRLVLTATTVALAATFPLAGVAAAQPTDRDCRDFASQAAAQSALRSHSGDPALLDADRDGVACEDWFAPRRPVAAPDVSDHRVLLTLQDVPGDGAVDQLDTTPIALLIGALGAVAIALGLRQPRARRTAGRR